MLNHFEINHLQIPYKAIKSYRIFQMEFIFRPYLLEVPRNVLGLSIGKKLEYSHLVPYAAIVSAERANYTFSPQTGEKVYNYRYQCIKPSGRYIDTTLSEVPALVYHMDGRESNLNPNRDSLFHTDKFQPSIQTVPTLHISADEEYYIFGEGIQMQTFELEQKYEELKSEMELLELTQPQKKTLFQRIFNK